MRMGLSTSGPAESSTDEVALTHCREAAELTGSVDLADQRVCSVDEQLAVARERLQALLTHASLAINVRTEACRQLYLVHRDQSRRLNERVTRSVCAVNEFRRSVGSLIGKSTTELIETVPRTICRELPFQRAMLSTVHGSVWVPRHTFFTHREPSDIAFERYASTVHIRLADAPFETEVLRSRSATMINSPESDRRTFKEFVKAAKSRGYVAAPITSGGRAIGILHADRPGGHGTVSQDDREILGTFAGCLSMLFESAMLADRLDHCTTTLEDEFTKLTGELRRLECSPYRVDRPIVVSADAIGTPFDAGGPSAPFLSAREREVLSHLATGATNAQIAGALVITEETVKSHLRKISKKLGTSTRSASVAKFAELTRKAAAFH